MVEGARQTCGSFNEHVNDRGLEGLREDPDFFQAGLDVAFALIIIKGRQCEAVA